MMVGTYPPLPDEHLPPPPLPEEDEEPPPLPPPDEEEDGAQLALIDPKNPPPPARPASPSEEEEESEAEEDLPPGPADPDQCIVNGPGTHGGCALRTVRFKVVVKDARGKALREGGDYIVARVSPGTAAQAAGAGDVAIDIEDQGNGTYVGAYQVPVRGDYKLIVDINGAPCGGSPFPLFFSPFEEYAELDLEPAGKAQAIDDVEKSVAARAAALERPSAGPAAVAAGVELPREEGRLNKCILIGNVSSGVTKEQLCSLFAFAGDIKHAEVVGHNGKYAILEFINAAAANAACKMHDQSIAGETVSVELVSTAREAITQTMRVRAANPLAAQQLQSLLTPAQLQEMQLEQRKLAEQVAAMRAAQRKKEAAAAAEAKPGEADPRKAAAMAAAAMLAQKLAGTTRAVGIGVARAHSERMAQEQKLARQRSRSRDRKRRSRSRDRRSPRDRRSRSRDRRSRSRSRKSRHRSRSRGSRRDRSRERRRDRSRERHRKSSRRDRSQERSGSGGAQPAGPDNALGAGSVGQCAQPVDTVVVQQEGGSQPMQE